MEKQYYLLREGYKVISVIESGDNFNQRMQQAIEEEYSAEATVLSEIDLSLMRYSGSDLEFIVSIDDGDDPCPIELSLEKIILY